jgi:nicotinate phosphoribosyltransferase
MDFKKQEIGMLTDLYELTMANVYFNINENKTAVFNFYVRPTKKRNFFIFAGLNELIDYLLNIKFSDEDIEYLKNTKLFTDEFLDYLKNFKFSGNLYAIKEGTIFFPNEPIIQIEAPLIEAQIIETFLINTLQLPILVASKSARCFLVANGKSLVDFSLRRTHGVDAGLKVAYASYISGFNGTSNVLAGKRFNIPIVGTMAHSFILALGSEEKAFEEFAKLYPENTIFLVDTFNTLEGVKKAINVIKKLGLKHLKGIRIDSGDLVRLSQEARKLLDEAGFKDAKIIASGGLDEYEIKELLEKGAKIDGFGVGTKLGVSADLPYLDCVYKLAEYDSKPVAKFSKKKTTFPFKKQIYRKIKNNEIVEDFITKFDENAEGIPLVEKYISDGVLIKELPSIEKIRDYTLSQLELLPEELKDIYNYKEFLPRFSESIIDTINALKQKYLKTE